MGRPTTRPSGITPRVSHPEAAPSPSSKRGFNAAKQKQQQQQQPAPYNPAKSRVSLQLQGKELSDALLRLKNSSSTDQKMDRLRTMDLFILDNSVRETTVAQIRGHTLADKYKLMDLVSSCPGIEDVVLGTFGSRPKIDDYFAQQCCTRPQQEQVDTQHENYSKLFLYCFAELRDMVIDGIPWAMTPVGILRAQQYKIPNIILEIDLLCPLTNWEEFGLVRYCELIHQRIDIIRNSCKNPMQTSPSRIFINIRDFASAWQTEPDRVVIVLSYLARMKASERIMGLCFEDPTGGVFPWILGEHVRRTRNLMDVCGWPDGHLLCHIHQAYGLAEAAVLECLLNGATGIWCGIPREGAAAGHANSLTTVVNLARAGNLKIREKFNIARMRKVAVEMTKIITGTDPHPMTELYGSRALDICFDPNMGMSSKEEEELLKDFQIPKRTRISTMCTEPMFVDALVENFGGAVSDYPEDIGKRMYDTIHEDLMNNRKEEYNSVVGLASLYERSGGKLTVQMRKVLAADHEMEDHPLVQKMHNYCLEWRSCRRANEKQITYIQFYDGFLAKYIGCFSCPLTRNAFAILDMDNNGYISWEELVFRAKWCIKEYPDLCKDIESAIRTLFEKYLIPEITARLRGNYYLENLEKEDEKKESHTTEPTDCPYVPPSQRTQDRPTTTALESVAEEKHEEVGVVGGGHAGSENVTTSITHDVKISYSKAASRRMVM